MNFETLQKLDKLQQEIDDRAFEKEKPISDEWEQFDVIIRSKTDEYIRRWVHVPTQSHDFHRAEPKRRSVVTRYAKELVWLFKKLEEIHPGEIERLSDHDFYGLLADAANLYMEENKQGMTASGLLETLVDEVREIYQ